MIPEETVLNFAASVFKSVWALELLLMLRRGGTRTWQATDIIRELRSSRVVVSEALNGLIAAGLVVAEDGGGYRYRGGTAATEAMITELEKLYRLKPTLVIRQIVTSSNAKLQILSDAFRIKE